MKLAGLILAKKRDKNAVCCIARTGLRNTWILKIANDAVVTILAGIITARMELVVLLICIRITQNNQFSLGLFAEKVCNVKKNRLNKELAWFVMFYFCLQ